MFLRNREGIYLLCIFLLQTNSHIKGIISHFALNYALNDFLEQYQEELIFLSNQDYEEVDKIRKNPQSLVESYLFSRIEPFLLPFYEKKKENF